VDTPDIGDIFLVLAAGLVIYQILTDSIQRLIAWIDKRRGSGYDRKDDSPDRQKPGPKT